MEVKTCDYRTTDMLLIEKNGRTALAASALPVPTNRHQMLALYKSTIEPLIKGERGSVGLLGRSVAGFSAFFQTYCGVDADRADILGAALFNMVSTTK